MTTTGDLRGRTIQSGMRTQPPDGRGARRRIRDVHDATELPVDASSPRKARAFVGDVLDAAGIAHEVVERARLLVSELVTNAILHARSAAKVTVEVRRNRVRVSVADASPTLPEARVPDPSQVTGRGLVCVDRLALRWGAEPTDSGKVVWFDLRAAGAPAG